MSDTPLKVVLVGTGGWGRQHARIFSQRPDIDFRAVSGRDAARTTVRAQEYGVRGYTNISEMLDREKPDLVSLCLPNQGHFEPTLQVIEAGYPLLVEKPLVFELDQAETLLAEAAKRGLFFAINFNHRYAKPVQLAYDAIQSGRLGDLRFATWRFGGEGSSDHPFANLIETQCHGFDMLEHLCGPIAAVSAEFTKNSATLALSLKFRNDAVGSLVGSYETSYAYPDTHHVEISGTKGRLVIEDTVRQYTFHATGNEVGETWQAGYFNDVDREFHKTFDAHIDAIIDAFRQDNPPPIHATAGYRALQLAHAAIQSQEQGKRIDIR